MRTVLGLSVNPRGIAWALVDGDGGCDALDDDVFDVEAAEQVTARATAAAGSARAIAAASGQDVAAIGVVWFGGDGADRTARLLDELAAAGFDDVRIVAVDDLAPVEDAAVRTRAQLRSARAAAHAVATGAVARVPVSTGYRRPAPRKHQTLRAVAAAAAAVAAGLLTVGSEFTQPAAVPVADDGDLAAAAAPQLVTVAVPREVRRPVPAQRADVPAVVPVAERAERAPVVAAVEVSTPVPAVASVQPAGLTETPVLQAVPVSQPVPVSHLPAGFTAPVVGPAAPEPHLAADPAPGPAPDPVSWLFGAMP